MKDDNDIPWYLQDFIEAHKKEASTDKANKEHKDRTKHQDSPIYTSNLLYGTSAKFYPDEFFERFQGSEQDLLERAIHPGDECDDRESTLINNKWNTFLHWGNDHFVLVLCAILGGLVLIYFRKKTPVGIKIALKNGKKAVQPVVNNDLVPQSNEEKIHDNSSRETKPATEIQNVAIFSERDSAFGNDIDGAQHSNLIKHGHKVNEITAFVCDMVSTRENIEILSNSQAWNEMTKEEKKDMLKELELKAQQAKKELVETIKHVSLRTHCFLCIILGCSTRLLLTHRDLLRQLLNDNGEISILDLLHEWIVVNACSCLVNDDKIIILQDNNIVENVYDYFSPNALWTYISPLLFNSSPLIVECYTKICFNLIILSLVNRLLTMLKSSVLNSLLNVFFLFMVLIRTKMGRSFLTLALSILVLNGCLCSIAYYFQCIQVVEVSDMKLVLSFSDEQIINRLMMARHDMERMSWMIYVISTTFAILLGYFSFLTII